MHCQLLTLNRPDSAEKDNLIRDVNRNLISSSGKLQVSTSGDTVTERRESVNFSSRGSTHNLTVLERKFRNLGDGNFEESSAGIVTMSVISGPNVGEASVRKYKFWHAIAAKSGFEIITAAKNNDGDVATSQGERLTTKEADGTYSIHDYNRGELHIDANGNNGESRTVLFASSRCTYTPMK
jgi:hypothetical protein